MELKGTIKVIFDTVQVSEKFAKREFVVTTSDDSYPQDVLFQATQDKCSVLDGYSVGDSVNVSLNIRGREWVNPQGESKYFNSLECWRIEKLGESTTQPVSTTEDKYEDPPF